LTLLTATALLYLWDLGASGWANTFYSAAVQAGSTSWKAMLFGSSDSSNFITVDKTPAFLWPMEISARIFGLNSWSLLAPQALEGVATVGLVYLSVRRWFSAQAALLAGAVVALTPVASMMFRYNGPDAMLALLLTAATYATMRALEMAQTRWLVLAGSLVGFGVITKMMQALLILPVMVVVYLLAAPTDRWCRRVGQVMLMSASVVVSAGWWVAAVSLTPTADRPFIGGTQNNSIVSLIFDYNGFGRIGTQTVNVAGQSVSSQLLGPTGINRLFLADYGNMMSWLLPGSLVMAAVLLALIIRAGRTDRERAALLLWGGSLFVTGLAISMSKGIVHPYYTVAMAPPLGAVVGISAIGLWRRRRWMAARIGLAAGLGVTVVWSCVLLGRTPDWFPVLRPFVAVAGTLGVIAILAIPLIRSASKLVVGLVATVGLVAALAAPLFSTVATAATPQTQAVPLVTPDSSNGLSGIVTSSLRDLLARCGDLGVTAGSVESPRGLNATQVFCSKERQASSRDGAFPDATRSTPALTKLLRADPDRYSWVAATVGSTNAAGYQLATRDPVMAIGGFHESDPAPTLAQFEKYVSEESIHYFIVGDTSEVGHSASGGSESDPARITSWVESRFTHETVGGVRVYDLSQGRSFGAGTIRPSA